MGAVKKRRVKKSSLKDTLPELIASALAREDDLIITCEMDTDSGRKTLHVMTGKLVSTCMLNKLKARIVTYPEDGCTLVSGTWK